MSDQGNTKYIEKLKTINSSVTKTKNDVHAKLKDAKKNIMTSLENLERKTEDNLEKNAKEIQMVNQKVTEEINGNLSTFKTEIDQTIQGLNEDVSSNISSMEEYGKQTLDDVEQTIALQLDTSLSNVKDSVKAHVDDVGKYDERLEELTTTGLNKSIDLVAEKDQTVSEELKQILQINQETLGESLNLLKNDFQVQIGEKVEEVFKGVVQTKEVLDSIITDTLSHLKSNLERLHSEIDSHFTKEVGELQDTILSFEEQMEKTVVAIVETYNKQMNLLLEKHKEKTQTAIGELRSELNKIKQELMKEISGLNEDQKKRVMGSLNFMETQVSEARKEVINSFATLRTELEKLGNSNKNLILQELTKFNEKTVTTATELQKSSSHAIENGTKTVRDITSESKEFLKGIGDQTKKEASASFKDAEKAVDEMVKTIIKETKEV